ncbi:MAG: tRNA (adenosine(37)-N6)-threonylcarbamoyltransferase complex transferase subunit TsaD [Candidatus Caenarcaniphilales bacterium]|nr:tRNA (adenosine(37)-N6)-threonylcarbamoyltransferase complex transferase subunit TsaD [Candidatus Caenarcaniphilales bacterium]
MIVLGIETSCDETSVALVENGTNVLKELTFSQIKTHQQFGGVVPEIAAREHLTYIDEAIWRLLENWDIKDIDRVAVVNGPGLVSSLLVGVVAAKTFSWCNDIELVNVNHLKAHICANFLNSQDIQPPFICLLASGGHTQLFYVEGYTKIQILGETLDDSAGEAFDKTARLLGLNYPGGPEIEKLSLKGNKDIFKLPKPKVGKYEFSFSGLKTAALRLTQSLKEKNSFEENKANIAANFQEVVCQSLTDKLLTASKEFSESKVVLAGGVAANKRLRQMIQENSENRVKLFAPEIKYCTDNGAMVASAGYFCPEGFGNDFSVYSRAK